jgi:hypothetical protein
MTEKKIKMNKKFWQVPIVYFSLIWYGPHRKRRFQELSLPRERLCRVVISQTLLWHVTDRTKMMRPTIILLLHVFVTLGTCLPSRCLAMKRGIHFIEPLPNNDRRDTHVDTQTDEKDLWSTLLRWAQLPRSTYQVSWRLIQALRSSFEGYTDKQTGWRSHKSTLGN